MDDTEPLEAAAQGNQDAMAAAFDSTPNSSIASPSAASASPLDNPIWSSLTTEHASLAEGGELARRYPAAIGPLSGMPEPTEANYGALRELAGPGGLIALFLELAPAPPPGWTLVRGGLMHQMIYLPNPPPQAEEFAPVAEIVQLAPSDTQAMVELAKLTEPGPFGERTRDLGTFFGIWERGRLVAMAGERTRTPRFVEVSAVCTHPDARGRGYGKAMTARVAEHIMDGGKTPYLHVFAANLPAIRAYESVGFTLRRTLELGVLRNDL